MNEDSTANRQVGNIMKRNGMVAALWEDDWWMQNEQSVEVLGAALLY